MYLDIFKKKLPCRGSVLFRGTMPARPEEFEPLGKLGISIQSESPATQASWALRLRHPSWGEAVLQAPRRGLISTPLLFAHAPTLSSAEREVAMAAGSELVVETRTSRTNIPTDRKNLLRFLLAILGHDGVAAVDWQALRVWSPVALRDELAHDADLDVSQLFGAHLVTVKNGEDPVWFHTHGLAAIGRFDFDILRPSPNLTTSAADAQRAIAYAILEGTVDRSTARFNLAHPGGEVRFVEITDFDTTAGEQLRALRPGGEDADHASNRAVLCEPAGRWLGRWSRKIEPSRFLSGDIPDGTVFSFSQNATECMAERARKTFSVFRQVAEEFADFGLPVLAKLGYEVDGGGPGEREHLWFQVQKFHNGGFDATLLNKPYRIAKMNEGDESFHPIERMTDWTILTPGGPISPRDQTMARFLRENRSKLLAALRTSGS